VKKLLQVVLEWSSCQQQLVVDLVVVETPEKLEKHTQKKSELNLINFNIISPFGMDSKAVLHQTKMNVLLVSNLLKWSSAGVLQAFRGCFQSFYSFSVQSLYLNIFR